MDVVVRIDELPVAVNGIGAIIPIEQGGQTKQITTSVLLAGLDLFLGTYTSLAALQASKPTANSGQYAVVDSGAGSNAQQYIWDVQAGWVLGSGTGGVASFNTRVGPVTFVASDIPATTVTPGVYTNANVTIGADGRVTAAANGTAGGGGLTSFNTRTAAAAMPTAGDYDAFYGSQVTNIPTIALLENSANWTINHYTGPAITNPQNANDWYVNEVYDYKFRTPTTVRRILYSTSSTSSTTSDSTTITSDSTTITSDKV